MIPKKLSLRPINSETGIAQEFTYKQIAELKCNNAWGKPLSSEKCVKQEIGNKKEDLPIKNKELKSILYADKTVD